MKFRKINKCRKPMSFYNEVAPAAAGRPKANGTGSPLRAVIGIDKPDRLLRIVVGCNSCDGAHGATRLPSKNTGQK
jgi:hypothetical protein